MPGCTMIRTVEGTTAHYALAGRFEGACAWELASRLERELLPEVVLDFSRVDEFLDYAIAVISGVLLHDERRLELRGLRQHQVSIFRCFGVEPGALAARSPHPVHLPPAAQVGASKAV